MLSNEVAPFAGDYNYLWSDLVSCFPLIYSLISDSPDGGESDLCTSDIGQISPAFSDDRAFVCTRKTDPRCFHHTRTSRTFASRHLLRRNLTIAGASDLPFNTFYLSLLCFPERNRRADWGNQLNANFCR